MWSGSRSEMHELSELSELSEPGGGAGTLVVWRTLCDYRVSGHFLLKNDGFPYIALLVKVCTSDASVTPSCYYFCDLRTIKL